MASLYDQDFHRWAMMTAEALRVGRLSEVTFPEVAEEIEDLGKSRRRALESCLTQLIMHLLKWDFQPHLRSRSWQGSIQKQRHRANKILMENPSLGPLLDSEGFLSEIYQMAIEDAVIETNLPEETFPSKIAYTTEFLLGA